MITVEDCLQLPMFCDVCIMAGHNGLSQSVYSITVLEVTDLTDFHQTGIYAKENELVVSSLYAVREDVEKQCLLIRRLHELNSVGLFLFETEATPFQFTPEFLAQADVLGYPIIFVPATSNLAFSDVIRSVSDLQYKVEHHLDEHLPNAMMQYYLSGSNHKDICHILEFLAQFYDCGMIFVNRSKRIVYGVYAPLLPIKNIEFELGEPLNNWCIRQVDAHFSDIFNKTFFWNIGQVGFVMTSIPFCDVNNREHCVFFVAPSSLAQFHTLQIVQMIRPYFDVESFGDDGIFYSDMLLFALVKNNAEYARYLGEQLNINLDKAGSMYIITCMMQNGESYLDKIDIHQYLSVIRDELPPLLVGQYEDNLVILFCATAQEDEAYFGERFSMALQADYPDAVVFVHSNVKKIEEFSEIFWMVQSSLSSAKQIFPCRRLYYTPQIRFITFCNQLWISHQRPTFLLLKNLLHEESLMIVLEALFLDVDMDVKKCAEILFLHKNTIYYRMKKIQKLLGYDPFSTAVSFGLMMELGLYRLEQSEKCWDSIEDSIV